MQYILPATLTFLFGLLFWYITRKRLSLEYEVVESETFPREEGEGRFFVIKLKNAGNKSLENVKLNITFQFGTIDSIRYSDSNLIKEDIRKNSQLSGIIPLLNPREILGITITTIGTKELSSPKIVARTTGVTAAPKKEEGIFRILITIIPAMILLCVIAIVIVNILLPFDKARSEIYLENRKQLEELKKVQIRTKENLYKITKFVEEQTEELKAFNEEQRKGKPKKEQIIFGLLNRAGLSHLLPSLISTGEGITYWKTGLFLMHSFLVDKENSEKYIDAMNQLIKIENMAASSLGFNLYILGKMEQFIGDSKDAIRYFEQCRKETPLMYEHLMAQDPTYDLKKLRQWLLRK